MTKRRRPTTETIPTSILDEESSMPIISSTVEKDLDFKPLRARLAEINKLEGVTGYIIRNHASAAIDLKDPSNLVAFALLSSHIMDACEEFSEMFNLGMVENTLLEGQNGKVLCLIIGENTISVFMEKTADHNKILEQILADLDQ